MNADEQIITKLRAKLRESEEALVETTGIIQRVIRDVRLVDPEKSYPKAAKILDWFYDQKEYDGPCKDKIL